MTRRNPILHPLAIAALPLPAIICALFARGAGVGLAAVTVGLSAALIRSPRLAAALAATAIGMTAVLWLGFAAALPDPGQTGSGGPGTGESTAGGSTADGLGAGWLGDTSVVLDWLPFQPSVAVAFLALRGALRIVAVMVLFAASAAWIRWNVLADSLIAHFRASYRVVDVVGLGGRFATLIRTDIRDARALARLRARGRTLRGWRLAAGLTVPVLMSAFRHADQLTIAMEARGFGARPTRTVHHAMPVRIRDAVTVALVWGGTIVAAYALDAGIGI